MHGLSWTDVFALFGPAIVAVVVAGVVLPLVGCFLLVRRTGFYGITLPQFAAAGVAFGFVAAPSIQPRLQAWFGAQGPEIDTLSSALGPAIAYHLFWALLFTFAGLGTLTLFTGHQGTETARVAAAFAIASTLTILFAHASPAGDVFVHELLRGEILAVGVGELLLLALVYGAVLVAIVFFHRDLVLCSYDPEMATVLEKKVRGYTFLLHCVTGAAVAAGVMIVGPVVLFGLLVVPPLAARQLARSMLGFLQVSSLLGAVAAGIGVWISFQLDWPLGPAVVAVASAELLASFAFAKAV